MQSKFYLLLKEAVTDDTSLIRVLNRYSRNYNGQIDEDLKSELIAKTIELVRKESIYKRFQ